MKKTLALAALFLGLTSPSFAGLGRGITLSPNIAVSISSTAISPSTVSVIGTGPNCLIAGTTAVSANCNTGQFVVGASTYAAGVTFEASGLSQFGSGANKSTFTAAGGLTMNAGSTITAGGFQASNGGLYLGANQALGVNTTSPGTPLDVNGASSFRGAVASISSVTVMSANVEIASGTLVLDGNVNKELVAIGASALVGVRTPSPATALHVSSGIVLIDGTSPKLGIGTTATPATALHISSGILTIDGNGGAAIQGSSASFTTTNATAFTLTSSSGIAIAGGGPLKLYTGGSVVFGDNTVMKTNTAPTRQVFTSGSGTYSTPANARYIMVRMVGGGGGGGGSGSAAGTAATAGGNTTFGTTLLVANGGALGGWDTNGGAGGTINLNGSTGVGIVGGMGEPGGRAGTGISIAGGNGGVSAFGGAGSGGVIGGLGPGQGAAVNSGSGGGGGYANGVNQVAGAGGGSGGYVDAIISAPAASYSYAVGGAGSAGGAGTGGSAGGGGSSGVIIVDEFY